MVRSKLLRNMLGITIMVSAASYAAHSLNSPYVWASAPGGEFLLEQSPARYSRDGGTYAAVR